MLGVDLDMTQEEKLDLILLMYKVNFQNMIPGEVSAKVIEQVSDTGPKDDSNVLYRMFVSKLVDDGMVYVAGNGRLHNAYITYKGYFFEGYEKRAKRLAQDASDERDKEDRMEGYTRTLAVWTPKAALFARAAAVAAFLLFAMELVKYFRPPLSLNDGETIVRQIGIFF